jgi:hypothetical protein
MKVSALLALPHPNSAEAHMHVISFLSRWLGDFTVVGHRARALALMKAVQSLILCGKLSLTHLGRHRCGSAHVKHHIKSVDRLLGNTHLHDERDGIYRAIAATLLCNNRSPVLVVDWSDFEPGHRWAMLSNPSTYGAWESGAASGTAGG